MKIIQNKYKLYRLGSNFNNMYLTEREVQCLRLLSNGKVIHEIATILSLSKRTVKYYISNMRQKLGCNQNDEMLSIIATCELIEADNLPMSTTRLQSTQQDTINNEASAICTGAHEDPAINKLYTQGPNSKTNVDARD